MLNLPDYIKDFWAEDKVDFEGLLYQHPSISHTQLGAWLGIPHAQRIVSARHTMQERWPAADRQRIADAHAAYDAGICELAQMRYKGHFFLYMFPRQKPASRRTYFSSMDRF